MRNFFLLLLFFFKLKSLCLLQEFLLLIANYLTANSNLKVSLLKPCLFKPKPELNSIQISCFNEYGSVGFSADSTIDYDLIQTAPIDFFPFLLRACQLKICSCANLLVFVLQISLSLTPVIPSVGWCCWIHVPQCPSCLRFSDSGSLKCRRTLNSLVTRSVFCFCSC